jgi:protein PsiE
VMDLKTTPSKTIGNAIHQVENAFLLVIAVFTVVGMIQEIIGIVRGETVALKDLLLMFIYVEVLGMIGAYYDSKRIPITLPLFIAMTALARLIILQNKDLPPINLLYEAAAILMLAIACAVIAYRPGAKKRDELSVGPIRPD